MAANKGGTITRPEIITDEALNWGEEYVKQVDKAKKANSELVQSALDLAKVVNLYRKAENQQQFIDAKNQEKLLLEQTIATIKARDAALISAEKVKQEALRTDKLALDIEKKKQDDIKKTTKLSLEERVIQEALNKTLKQQARENAGLETAYQKLNRKRTEAQTTLANLLSEERKNIVEIKIAQREFEILDARVKAVDAAIKNYSKNIGNYSSAFSGLNGTLQSLMSAFGITTGLALFATSLEDIFQVIQDFDRQLIAVGKTTNITGEDLRQFGREVVELGESMHGVSIEGLLKSAEVAGQLGVQGTENILKFSAAIEKLKLTSNIISDEQVGDFAKFIEVSEDSFENADRLASVITRLGNEMATTEAEVLANSTEIQKGIAVYHNAASGVLALGAATSTLGSEAEASRSAIQSTYAVINNAIATGAKLEKVLKLTGYTQKELSDQFNKDGTVVFERFVAGLNKAKNAGANLTLELNDLHLTEKRAFTVIGALAANYEVLQAAMISANDEYKLNAALNKEVEAASQSIVSIVGDIKDEYDAYILTANDVNDGTAAIVKTLSFLRDNFKDIINYILKYGSVLLTFLAVQRAVNFAITLYSAIQTAATVAQIRFALATGIGTRSILAQAAAAREAAAAQEGLNIAMTATPWGAILALLSAIVVAYMVFNDEMSKSEMLIDKIKFQTKSQQEAEKFYADERDKNQQKSFKAIEDEISLRRAKGENGKKLDEEEIKRKKEIIQSELDVFNNLKETEISRTKEQIKQSQARIAQMIAEKDAAIAAEEKKSGRKLYAGEKDFQERRFDTSDQQDKLTLLKSQLQENSKLTIAEQKRLRDQLAELDKDANLKAAAAAEEESKKEHAARLKRLKAAYDARKKLADDEYKLSQFRLQAQIDQNADLLANDKAYLADKLDALSENTQLVQAKLKETAEYELKNLGKYNEEKGIFIRQLTDVQISEIVRTGKTSKKLTDEQQLIYEKYQNELTKFAVKGELERQRLIDANVEFIQKNIDAELARKDIELNQAIAAENTKFAALNKVEDQNRKTREAAVEEHERRIWEIKKDFAKKQLQIQIDALQRELDDDNNKFYFQQMSADKRLGIEQKLNQAKADLGNLGVEDYKGSSEKKAQIEQEFADRVEEIGQNLNSALGSLANALFDAKIQNIDAEIQKNNDFYANQMALAGDDQRKKDALQKEQQKKNDVLEKKKREEQHKQAVFNKAMAIAQATIGAALAVIRGFADSGYVGAILAGVIGAIEIAAIIATPIPKYRTGRKGGPDELAYINDGGVTEVVSDPDGSNPRMTPKKNALVRLLEGDVVHQSTDHYKKFMRDRFMSKLAMENHQMNQYQTAIAADGYSKDILDEMKRNTRAIEKIKLPPASDSKPQDLNHQLWKYQISNWH